MLTTADAATMCPKCGGDGFVYWTFDGDDGARIRRRRCKTCGTKYETREKITRIISRGKKIK